MLPDKAQRRIPLILQLILTLILLQKAVTVDRFMELYYFFSASCIGIVAIFLLLYLKIKASIHLFAISSFTFFAIGMALHNQLNCTNQIALLFLITGFVATSRLQMKAHTTNELFIGYATGMFSQVILFYFWL